MAYLVKKKSISEFSRPYLSKASSIALEIFLEKKLEVYLVILIESVIVTVLYSPLKPSHLKIGNTEN
jgi:hypothetical protein